MPFSPDSDRAAYERWVQAHSADLYRFAYRLTGRADKADDLLQETFLEAWKSRQTLQDPSAVRPWLFTILRHRFSRLLRAPAEAVSDSASLEVADPASHAPFHTEVLADRDALQVGLDALDESVRIPFLMVFVEGLSCKEAAESLHIPVGTVLSRLSRARAALRMRLASSYQPTERAMHG